MTTDEILKRVDYVLAKASATLSNTRRSDFTTWVDAGTAAAFRAAGLTLIRDLYGTQHHHYDDFVQAVTSPIVNGFGRLVTRFPPVDTDSKSSLAGQVASKTLFAGGEPDSAIAITFGHSIAQFLIGWGDPNFSGNVLRAYSSSGVLLEEAHVAVGPPGGVFATWIGFSRPTADIAMIVVQPDQSLPSGDDYVIDNIHYNTKPVPEPATLMLLGVGLASLGIFRRWQSRYLSSIGRAQVSARRPTHV